MVINTKTKKKEDQQPKVDNGKKSGESPAQDIQERAGKKSIQKN